MMNIRSDWRGAEKKIRGEEEGMGEDEQEENGATQKEGLMKRSAGWASDVKAWAEIDVKRWIIIFEVKDTIKGMGSKDDRIERWQQQEKLTQAWLGSVSVKLFH